MPTGLALKRLLRPSRCSRWHLIVLAGVLAILGLLLLCLRLTIYQMPNPAALGNDLTKNKLEPDEFLVTLGSNPLPAAQNEVAVVVLAANRPEVQQLLRQLMASRPAGFRILVSQDGSDPSTAEVLRRFDASVTRLRLHVGQRVRESYARISRHHLHLLNHVFLTLGFRHAILLEDDLLIAPDFYSYFGSLRTVLDSDPSVFCVSAWNDNGMTGLVADDPTLLHRTDFFPGLGWMINRAGWLRVRSLWPDTQFDDFLRKYMLMEGLVCVRPEISRTFNIGRCGGREVGGMETYARNFYQKYLSRVVLNQRNISLPTSSIRSVIGRSVDEDLEIRVRSIPEFHFNKLLSSADLPATACLRYATVQEYLQLAKLIGIIPEVWFSAPRASIRGIVTVSIRGCRVYIAPDARLPFSDSIVIENQGPRPSIVWGVILPFGVLSLGCLLGLTLWLLRKLWGRLRCLIFPI